MLDTLREGDGTQSGPHVGLTSYKGVLGSNFNYGDHANATPAFKYGGDGFRGANGLFSLDIW